MPLAPTYGPTGPQDTQIRTRVAEARDLLAGIPSPSGLPSFDLRTLLPLPEAFDAPIRALEDAARTFDSVGGPLSRTLGEVMWKGADAAAFRDRFESERQQRLRERAADLERLATTLRAYQRATKDEWDLLGAIRRQVIEFIGDVQRAYQQAAQLALDKLGTARRALAEAGDAVGHHVDSLAHGARALGEAIVPGGRDGREELRQAALAAEGGVEAAQRALDAVVDFVSNWPYRPGTLPEGVCRQWYAVDEFMAAKSGSGEAYGALYRRPPSTTRAFVHRRLGFSG